MKTSKSNPLKYYSALVAPAIVTIALWLLLADGLQFFLVEKYLVIKRLPEVVKLALMLLLVGAGLLTSLKLEKQNRLSSKSLLLFSSIVLILALFTHHQYLQFSLWFRTLPQVSSLSKNWTIQGDRVAIYGRNFGYEQKELSKVSVGDLEFQVVNWGNQRIVVEQPVHGEYFTSKLKVCNHHGNCTSGGIFSIKDPAKVL